jgi:hypothetical protein
MMFEKLRRHRQVIAHWAMELLIVVAGVLIALGAQQWAQDRSSKQSAASAEARIREELTTNVLLGVERITINNCIKQRLSRLANELTANRREWSDFRIAEDMVGQTAFREIYRVPSRVWVSTEYNGSLSNGHLASLAPERATQLANAYAQVEDQRARNGEEARLSAQLGLLQFNQSLSIAERNALLATLTRLDWLNGVTVIVARQNIEAYRRLGYRMSVKEMRGLRQFWSKHLVEVRARYGSCVQSQAIAEFDSRLTQQID